MRTHESAGYALGFDLRHVAGYALTAWAAVLVVGMLLQTRGVWAIRRCRPMTVQAEFVHRLSKLRIVLGAMHIMAGRACDTVLVHNALHEVIPLHSVLVCGSVREMGERRLTQGDVFELPIIFKVKTDVVSDGPVVGFALDLFGERLPL